jgi:hypothetical protein
MLAIFGLHSYCLRNRLRTGKKTMLIGELLHLPIPTRNCKVTPQSDSSETGQLELPLTESKGGHIEGGFCRAQELLTLHIIATRPPSASLRRVSFWASCLLVQLLHFLSLYRHPAA